MPTLCLYSYVYLAMWQDTLCTSLQWERHIGCMRHSTWIDVRGDLLVLVAFRLIQIRPSSTSSLLAQLNFEQSSSLRNMPQPPLTPIQQEKYWEDHRPALLGSLITFLIINNTCVISKWWVQWRSLGRFFAEDVAILIAGVCVS